MSRRSQIGLIGISGIVVTENGWRSVTLSPRSADLLDTDLNPFFGPPFHFDWFVW